MMQQRPRILLLVHCLFFLVKCPIKFKKDIKMQFLTVLKLPAIDQGREVCVEIVHEITSSMIVTEVKYYFSS
jgi:hypothetical protein